MKSENVGGPLPSRHVSESEGDREKGYAGTTALDLDKMKEKVRRYGGDFAVLVTFSIGT